MAGAATAQVNARIDPGLKRLGDKGLAAAGLTPTEGVRALYQLAAKCVNKPADLKRALFPDDAADAELAAESERKRKLALLDRGARYYDDACASFGLRSPSAAAGLSPEELRDLALDEKFAQMMGWGE